MSDLIRQGVRYAPIVRTRDAELRGFRELPPVVLDSLLPVFELTRSRRAKSNPSGAVTKCVSAVSEIMGDRPFVADVTSLESQANGEVESLLDPTSGFRNWIDFALNHLPRSAIPVVHLTDPFDASEFTMQISALAKKNGTVALRFPTSYGQADAALAIARNTLPKSGGVVCIVDAGFVKPSAAFGATSAVVAFSRLVSQYDPICLVPACSSFPGSVVATEYGSDEEGQFELTEVSVSNAVKSSVQARKILHGDYAAVHPLDFQGTVTAWVPRVDVPLDNSIYYHRFRRHLGGYVLAAKRALADARFVSMDCWGVESIRKAAEGSPPGKNPAHWIAVRINIHIHRQAARLTRA